MNTDDGFDFLPVKYILSNAKGEQVNLVSSSMLGYMPTGLGVAFSNSYSQYDNYFSLTKSKIKQGQMSLNILFGEVDSLSYATFSEFATFLSYQPLTLSYVSSAGTWQRDARVASLNKSEIGGGVSATDKLNESFTLDFVNPWYNNKSVQYIKYKSDPNLAMFGRGYFNANGTKYYYAYGDSTKRSLSSNQITDRSTLTS